MIDLREKALPNTVQVNGRAYSIYTDFRYWLKFSELIKKKDLRLGELYFLFKNDTPYCNFYDELMEFFTNKNATPKGNGSSERIVDYILDGEYIYASFMQAYGIDLLETDMHWHKFKALFVSLPSDCKICQIMADRAYKEDKRKYETICMERKNEWSLPAEKVDDDIIKGLQADFYNA